MASKEAPLNRLDPRQTMDQLTQGVIREISEYFPYENSRYRLEASNISADTSMNVDDFPAQYRTKMRGQSWTQPVTADFKLIDRRTSRVVSEKKGLRVASIPHITSRYSYIIDGKEYQPDNQTRLMSGVYTRRKANGELEAQFNLAKGRGFTMQFEPEKRRYLLRYGSTNIPLVPVLRALGVSDQQMKRAWGEGAAREIMAHRDLNALGKLAKSIGPRNASPATDAEKIDVIKKALDSTEMYKDTTEITLGKGFDKVNGEALLTTATKLLNINRGVEEVDNRDSYRFKHLWDIADHIPERIRNSQRAIKRKLSNNFNRKAERGDIRAIVDRSLFQTPIKTFFTTTELVQQPDQTNPIHMLGGHHRLTMMGTGGIATDQAITFSAKGIDSSQLGLVDPVYTPEGARTGITTHLTLGATKIGKNPATKVINARTGKIEFKTATELYNATVAFPDEYKRDSKGKMQPRTATVRAVRPKDADPVEVPSSQVDYIISSGSAMFSTATNLIPFLPSDQAGRAGMADRHMEQAISLTHREEPLVQVATTQDDPRKSTWERVFGRIASQVSPVEGKVTRVEPNRIVVRDNKGKDHTVHLYNNFPLNDKKGFMHSEPVVAVGDTVGKDDLLADTNFTRGGTLSLGVNLRVAYLPYKGLVFEDGIVISRTGSKKLSSEHMHKKGEFLGRDTETDLKKFRAMYPGVVTQENADKLDERGIIKPGTKVMPGETLAAILRKKDPSKEALLLRGVHRSLIKPFKDASVVWNKPYVGEVVAVNQAGRQLQIHVRTSEPASIGDKLSGRYGNKGVITAIIEDEDMPHDKDGNPVEIIMNPSGVPGRINPAQILETALAKAADKQGKIMQVSSFPDDLSKAIATGEHRTVKVKGHWRTVKTNKGEKRIWIEPYEYETDGYRGLVEKALKEAGVDERDELIDPETGRSLGKVLVGKQYVIKQHHQVGKKLTARAHGYGHAYDINETPRSSFGGNDGAQRFGELGLYAMLAHGAVNNIRDALTYKSDRTQEEVWDAIQSGHLPPAPKESFAYQKFLGYLNVLGVNVEKEGNELTVLPLTDKQAKEMSNGELKHPEKMLKGKNLEPEEGGLFDEKVTGGVRGKKWSHIGLAEEIVNPMFERSILALFGLRGKDFDQIVEGKAGIDKDGKFSEESKEKGMSSLVAAVKRFDEEMPLEKRIAKERKAVKEAKGAKRDKARKRLKFLLGLQKSGLSASDAYLMSVLPVLPPHYRPVSAMESGDLNIDGLNQLYHDVALLNGQRKKAEGILPDSELQGLTADLYDAVEALMGVSPPSAPGQLLDGGDRPPGVLTILSGRTSPKHSFFHKRLLDRKQDLTSRTVIVPDMDLHLDEVGVPRDAAKKIFRPFVVRELTKMGLSPLKARTEVEKDTPLANRALEIVANKTPVIFKRDPVLHKFGIMGFMPKLVDGKAIHIHPLTVGGFGADFDGDQMALFVPVTQAAKDEVYKMFPSKNLFSPATGRVMYQPGLEGQLGLFLMTQWGKEVGKSYASGDAAVKAARAGEISMSDVITVDGKKTTAGRLAFYNTLPEEARSDAMLTDPERVMGKKNLQAALRAVAMKSPLQFAQTADKIKDLGFGYAYDTGFSFSLDDFKTLKGLRDKHVHAARAKVGKLPASLKGPKRDAKVVEIYTEATNNMDKEAKAYLRSTGNKLAQMEEAGVKPSWAQLRQLIVAPMLLTNSEGRTIPVPVIRNYSEGLSASGYWTASAGARKGQIEKVQSVSEPGALSKQIVNTSVPYVVTTKDCGTKSGIVLSKNDPDVVDRALYKDLTANGVKYEAGTLITPKMMTNIRSDSKIRDVPVRSPHRCEARKGLCSTCYGRNDEGKLLDIGTNIGVIAGQAVGERGTQLSMKAFHCNHGDALVILRDRATGVVSTVTMAEFYDVVASDVLREGGEEIKEVSGWEVWDDGVWTNVTHVRRHAPDDRMVAVGGHGRITVCQANHPIAAHADPAAPEQFVQAGDLHESWYVRTPTLPEVEPSTTPTRGGYLVGAYLAEGCVGVRASRQGGDEKPYSIMITQQPGELRDHFLQAMQAEGWRVSERADGKTLEVHSLDVGEEFLGTYRRYSHAVRLPHDFMSYTDEWLADMLCGVIDGDGCVVHYPDAPPRVQIETTSFALAQQLVLVHERLGGNASLMLTSLRALSRHQGYKVSLGITAEVLPKLSNSVKLRDFGDRTSPNRPHAVFRKVRVNREVLYHLPYVYDLTTDSGTLTVSFVQHHNTGGVAGSQTAVVGGLERITQLLKMPKILRGKARLADVGGEVTSVEKSPLGGHYVTIGGKQHYTSGGATLKVKKGDTVRRGDALTEGPVDPRELLERTNLARVQSYLTDEIHKVYSKEGIKRRNMEVVTKSLTDLGVVTDSGSVGDTMGVIDGDYIQLSAARAMNKKNPGMEPIKVQPVLRGVETVALDRTTDWLARMQYRRLRETLVSAANEGWGSDIHGTHPVPGIVYSKEFGKPKNDPESDTKTPY